MLQLLGFLGGIHLAILVALVCQGYPNASISSLMSIFFECFSCWPWPQPVILLDKSIPPFKYPAGRSFMPIMMPCSPFDWCNSNITKSTFGKIKAELQRGHFMTRVCSVLSHLLSMHGTSGFSSNVLCNIVNMEYCIVSIQGN